MKNKSNPVLDMLSAVAIAGSILAGVFIFIGLAVSIMWNLVMPVLGLPPLTAGQGIILYALIRALMYNASVRKYQQPITIMNLSTPQQDLPVKSVTNKYDI